VLAAAEAFEILWEPKIFEEAGVRVEVVPFHTGPELDVLDRILRTPPRAKGVDYRIGIAHAMARPGGVQEMHGQAIIGYDLLEDIDFDVFLWGHDHSRVEPKEVGACTHFHPGSMARAALSGDEVDRPVTLLGLKFTSEGWGFKETEIPVQPTEVVFRTADKGVEKASEGSEIKGFLQGMQESIGSIEIADPLKILDELCKEDPKLKALVLELCEY